MAVNFITDDTFTIVSNTEGGNFTYKAFASNSSGANFSLTYSDAIHTHEALLTVDVEIVTPTVSDFAGLWVPLQKQYTYKAYSSDDAGSDFALTYSSEHAYEALLVTSTYISTPIASDFTGLWVPMQKTYTYVAYADYNDGTGFTEVFDNTKLYFALLVSDVEIPVRTSSTYTGLWQIMRIKKDVYDYNTIALDTSGSGSYHSNTMGGSYNGPCAIYYKGAYERIYFTITEFYEDSNGDPIANGKTTHRVGYIDVRNNLVSNIIEIPFGRPQAIDTHTVPAIAVTDTGHIIIVYEVLTGNTASAHNSNLAIWRSNDPESIEDSLNPGTHNFTNVATIGGLHSYPKIFTLENGNINIITRRNAGVDHAYMCICRSVNDGLNWVNLAGTSNIYTDIVHYDRTGGPIDWYFYNYGVYGAEEYGINIVAIANEGPGGTSPDGTSASSHMKTIYFLHSDDGITWENVHRYLTGSNGYSKNILVSGVLDYTEMDTYFEVDDVSTDVEIGFAMLYATLNEEDGNPYILYGTVDRNIPLKDNCFTLLNLAHYDVDTSSWVIKDILDVYQLGSNTIYGKNFYGGALGTLKVYNDSIIDVGINRPTLRYYKDPARVDLGYNYYETTVLDGRKYMITKTDTNHFGTGLVVGDIVTALENTFTINSDNTLEPLISELVIFRTYDGGDTWSIIFEDSDPRHQGYNGPYMANDGGRVSNYTAIFKSMVRPYDGTTAGGRADFKIILGNRI